MQSKKQMIVFDADSVLLDWFLGFVTFLMERNHSTDHVKQFIGTTQFVPIEEMTQVDCEEYNKQLLKEFAKSGHLSNLNHFQENASVILEALSKDYYIAVVTCIGRTDDLIKQRNENLIKRYGDIFERIICLNFGESKEQSLRELNDEFDVVLFIDDRIKHLEEAAAVGITPALMSRGVDVCPIETGNFHVISCLSEIQRLIKKP